MYQWTFCDGKISLQSIKDYKDSTLKVTNIDQKVKKKNSAKVTERIQRSNVQSSSC